MRLLSSPWDAPHHPARPLLLTRGLYAILALDAWALMLQHGGRYGVGSFNVAHFDLLDRLFPSPGPALYLGLITAAGLYAFAGIFGQLRRIEALLLWFLYTLAWMLSMHDSYQHHYLLSWLLGFAIFAPPLTLQECLDPRARIREVSFPLFATCCGLVYVFTAISKASPIWLSGAVMRKLAGDGGPLVWLPRALAALGVEEASAWRFAASSIVIVQLVIALGFFAACFRDALRSRAIPILCGVALLAAAGFHVSTELTPSFAIGWFSYYMLWLVFVSFLPSSWLSAAVNRIERFRTSLPNLQLPRRWHAAVSSISLLVAVVYVWKEVLPGAGAAALLFASAFLTLRGRKTTPSTQVARFLPALAIATLSATLSLAHVRFDYYRRLAGELSRMGQLQAALDFYRLAQRHAPAGNGRETKIRELERKLEQPRSD